MDSVRFWGPTPPPNAIRFVNVGLEEPPCNPLDKRRRRRMQLALALFERPETPALPFAVRHAAGFALQPGLRLSVHIARQKIAAGESAFAVRGSERGDVPAGSGIGILPGDAGVLGAMPHDVGRDRTRIGKF